MTTDTLNRTQRRVLALSRKGRMVVGKRDCRAAALLAKLGLVRTEEAPKFESVDLPPAVRVEITPQGQKLFETQA